jgi:mannose-6-phosphate isomerase-like protein (cupin superfamily)
MGLIETPLMIVAAGSPPKQIAEFVGRRNTNNAGLSIARMVSPGGWQEPGQTPEFDEYTLVLRGLLRIVTRTGVTEVKAGQAFLAAAGEWVRYSTPNEDGAEYIAICVPAFSPNMVHRDLVED